MYLHVGNNRSLRTKDIIGIFDMDTATVSPTTKQYLKNSERENRTVNVSYELPKSFIITRDEKIYFSQISTHTLMGRIHSEKQL